MKRICIITVLAAFLILPAPARSEDGSGGTTSPFALGSGVRNIAMGNAAVAVWGGSYALIWNPAGLERIDRAEISLFHTSLFDDEAAYYSILGSYPFLEMGTISFGALQLAVDGIESRDASNMLLGDDLSCRQTRYIAGYSRKIYGPFTGGLTIKLDRFSQGNYSANGFGADLGLGYERTFESSRIEGMAGGLTLFNLIEPTMKIVEEESGDPRGVRAGIAIWGPVIHSIDDRLIFAFDLDDKRYSEMGIHTGIEYSIQPHLAFRGGYDDGFPVFGLGFRFSTIELDYAYRTSDLESYHLFSLTVGFGPTRSQRLENLQVARELKIRNEIEREIASYEDRFIEGFLREAEEALKDRRFADSVDLFDKVLLMDPGNESALEGRNRARILEGAARADVLFESGDYAGALLIYRNLSTRYDSKELDSKIEACDKLISKADNKRLMAETMFESGLEYYSDRKWYLARGAFNEVLELYPGHELASSYLRKSDTRIEEEHERILLRVDELIASRRFGEAQDLIRMGMESYGSDSGFESRQARLRQMQVNAGREKSRLAALSAESRPKPSRKELEKMRSVYERGAEHFRAGKFDMAVSEWESIWEKYPGYENLDDYLVKAYQYWGMELYTKHKYDEALEVWQRILRVDDNNEKALRYIQRTREERGRLKSLTS